MRQGAAVLAAEDAGPHRRARAAVRAMAPVAEKPPKNTDAMFPSTYAPKKVME